MKTTAVIGIIALANRAEELVPRHPALARVRGDALRNAWKLDEAAREYAAVVEASPRDDGAAGDLAMALAGAGRFEAAGKWNAMVTHRVRIGDPHEIDKEVLAWLRRAYDAAG